MSFHFLFLILASLLPAEKTPVQRLIVQSSSTLTIAGKTSVNKYHCTTAKYLGSDTLVLIAEQGKAAVFEKGIVRLKASGFDCGMKAITKDFAKTISAEKYPFIEIKFISFKRIPRYGSEEEKLTGKLEISLANKTVPVEITCGLTRDENDLVHLTGSRNFTFSDFNLEPPSKKMLGLVKVDENLLVDFHLVLVRQ